jgi:signal transduction histidine kinase/ligand-binding sensor domain-containing protein
MRRAIVLAPVLVAGLAAPGRGLDSDRATSQYVVTRWGARDLSSSSVHALLQTRDHYLWLGTAAGLVRFDGARFVPLGSGVPGLHEGGVASLAEGNDGALYVGTSAGNVFEYRKGTFARLPVFEAAGAVRRVLPRAEGEIWIAVHGRPLYRYKDGVAAHVGTKNINAPLALAEDPAGTLWVGTGDDGLMRVDGEKSSRQELAIKDAVQAVLVDHAGTIWMGTPHGLLRARGGKIDRFTTADGLSHDNVSTLLEDQRGNLWIGTAGGGLTRLSHGRMMPLTTSEGLSNDHVRSLLEDHEGNLWVGTADGLDCLSDGRFITYGRLEGLADPAVTAVAGTRDGSVWIGMNSAGLARLKDGKLERFRLPAGVGSDAIITLAESRHGGVWVLPDNGRVFEIEGGKVEEHTPAYEDSFHKARAVFDDGADQLLFITGVGPARLHGNRAEPIYQPAPSFGYYHACYRDASGALWFSTSVGLARLTKDRPTLLRQRDGLPNDRVRWVCGDAEGGLWIATIGGLAYRRPDGTIHKLTSEQGLPEDYLRAVLDDGLGYLWIASMGRIFRVSRREVLDVFAGRLDRVSPLTFDTWDGLRATEAGALSNSPAFRARDGRLWFATAQGAAVVDPSKIAEDDHAPQVVIEGMTVDGRHDPDGVYAPGRGELTIDYTALAFRSPTKVQFRYRLEGFDERWVEAGNRRSAYYSRLDPGHYRFTVVASNRDGRWSGSPTTLELVLQPPFYRTLTFYLGCTALVLGLAAAVHRLRVRTMHARLTAIIHERTRIARELHDTLAQGLAGVGLQLHSAMSILPRQSSLDRVRGQLEQAHSMIRSSLAEVRRSIWVLRAQTARDAQDLVTSLSDSLGQLTADSGARARFDVTGEPRPLPPDLERNLLRIAHEAVTNAVRHAAAREITIALQYERDHVRLRVRDDGRGFDPEAALRQVRGEHFGLVGISERTRSMGGEITLTSRPGAGAEIDCRLPYHHAEVPPAPASEGAPS